METSTEVNGITYINITQEETPTVNPVEDALVDQMNHEFNNYRIYKNFSGICDRKSLLGFCEYFNKQAEDEKIHFEKFYNYLCDKNMTPTLGVLEELLYNVDATLEELFMLSTHTENLTTTKLLSVKRIALEECDYQTVDFLDWFLLEQIEKEKSTQDALNRVRLSANNLLLIDQELGEV